MSGQLPVDFPVIWNILSRVYIIKLSMVKDEPLF